MCKFTKGPWTVTGQYLIRMAYDLSGPIVARAKMPRTWDRMPESERRANARLISKAPEMYALLNELGGEDLITRCADEGTYCNSCDGDMYKGEHTKNCLCVRAEVLIKEIDND